ncbi:MAG: hypothetical protein AABY64_01265 [Bdellovibrionota bacterium]
MNDFIILGILAFSLIMLHEFLEAIAKFTLPYRERILARTLPEKNIGPLLFYRSLLAIGMPLPRKYLHEIKLNWSKEPQKTRTYILSYCLWILTLWPAILLTLGFLTVNSILLLGIGFAIVIFANLTSLFPKTGLRSISFMKNLGKLIICLALVCLSFEFSLQWSSLLQTWGSENGFSYFLADGRFFNLLLIIGLGLICALILPYEGWYWIWPLIMYFNKQLSLNGAVAFFLSGMVGILWASAWGKKTLRSGAIIGACSAILGFFLFGALRNELNILTSGFENSQIQKLFSLCFGWSIILGMIFLSMMVWGHFRALPKSRL